MMTEGDGKCIWTIGHSTRPIDVFIKILHSFDIRLLADIRTLPGSTKFPHFNKAALEAALLKEGISYIHMPDLGGRRRPRKDSVNTAWRSKAFQGYADYMETDIFKHAIEQLEQLACMRRTAYMCSEAVWWRCHRALVSDYLKVSGWKVIHIMDENKGSEHPYTSPARPVQGNLFYGE